LANFAKTAGIERVSTMNVSLPDQLKAFVEAQADRGAYGSTSEYVRDLIRRDQERFELRRLLLGGAESPVAATADASFFDDLRARTRQ